MSFGRIPVLVALLCMSVGPLLHADEMDKSVAVKGALEAVQKIYALGARNHWVEIKSDQAIQLIIGQLTQVAELEKCAILCMQIASPMEAGDNGFDSYFYIAHHACIDRLARIKGHEAGDALKTIEWATRADGGEREWLDDAIKAQKKL